MKTAPPAGAFIDSGPDDERTQTMLPYTANDMLNKMQDEYGLEQVTELPVQSLSRHPSTIRHGRIRRAITSLLGGFGPH